MVFGVAWFGGSALMGWLYDNSIALLVTFSVSLQMAALPFFAVADRLVRRAAPSRHGQT